MLIDAKCDINAVNGDDVTALHIAVRNRSEAIVKLLLDNRIEKDAKRLNGDTALHIATKNGDITIVKMLVDAKCDINAVDGNGATALVFAAKIGNKNLVEYFIEKGADIQKTDCYGKTYKDYYEMGFIYQTQQQAGRKRFEMQLEKKLKDFAIENNEGKIDWKNKDKAKWGIFYDYQLYKLTISGSCRYRYYGQIYLTSLYLYVKSAI